MHKLNQGAKDLKIKKAKKIRFKVKIKISYIIKLRSELNNK